MITMFRAVLLGTPPSPASTPPGQGHGAPVNTYTKQAPAPQTITAAAATATGYYALCNTPTRVNFQEPITGCRTTPWCSQSHQAAGLGLPKPKPRQGPLTTASGLPGAATLGINRNNRANLGRILADTQCRTNTHKSWYGYGSLCMCGTGSPPRSSSVASGAVLRPAALGPLHGCQHVCSRRGNVTCAQPRVSHMYD